MFAIVRWDHQRFARFLNLRRAVVDVGIAVDALGDSRRGSGFMTLFSVTFLKCNSRNLPSADRDGKALVHVKSRSEALVPAGNVAGFPTAGWGWGTASEQSMSVDTSWPVTASLAIAYELVSEPVAKKYGHMGHLPVGSCS